MHKSPQQARVILSTALLSTSDFDSVSLLTAYILCWAGAELREQVAHLQAEYSSVGDQLEQEQSRAQQVMPPPLKDMTSTVYSVGHGV